MPQKNKNIVNPLSHGMFQTRISWGGGFHPPPKISGPIAPRKVKFYMHVAFDLYFQNMSRKVQLYCLNGLNLALIFWPEFCLEKASYLQKTISPEPFGRFFCYLYIWNLLFKTKILSPVGGLYDPPFKIRKFVMQ